MVKVFSLSYYSPVVFLCLLFIDFKMLSLILSLPFQNEFINAITNETIVSWVNDNKNVIESVSNNLKDVAVPKEKGELCKFICDSFSLFFEILCKTEQKKVRKIPKKRNPLESVSECFHYLPITFLENETVRKKVNQRIFKEKLD